MGIKGLNLSLVLSCRFKGVFTHELNWDIDPTLCLYLEEYELSRMRGCRGNLVLYQCSHMDCNELLDGAGKASSLNGLHRIQRIIPLINLFHSLISREIHYPVVQKP